MTDRDALALLRELTAMVRAECPSLLNEDSGGDARLSLAIDDALSTPPPAPAETRCTVERVPCRCHNDRPTIDGEVGCARCIDSPFGPTWIARRVAATPPPADLVALGERLRTQDNQMTAHPIFVVEHRDDARRPWEFVTACLTDEGARAYMNANGHNLRKFSRIFVHSGYRNDQWIGLRNHLMALPAAPPVTDTPQPGEMPPSSTWSDIGPQPKGWPDGNNPVRWNQKPDCVIGVYCQRHGFIHGQEAEELRERLEELGDKAVNRVLDEVDARDSLAYLEATNEPTPPDATSAAPPQED